MGERSGGGRGGGQSWGAFEERNRTRRRRLRDLAGPRCPSPQGRREGGGPGTEVHCLELSRECLLMAGSSSEQQVIGGLWGTREGRRSGAIVAVAMRFA